MSAFCRELLAAVPTEHRPAVVAVLREWRGVRVYIAEVRTWPADRRQVARALLDNGTSKTAAARALVQQFGITPNCAWRDVNSVAASALSCKAKRGRVGALMATARIA